MESVVGYQVTVQFPICMNYFSLLRYPLALASAPHLCSLFHPLQVEGLSDIIFLVKPIKYVRHARNRMRLHRVTEAEVESTIRNPEYHEPSVEGRFNAWRESSGKFLRVTYKKEENNFLVISVVRKRKRWR